GITLTGAHSGSSEFFDYYNDDEYSFTISDLPPLRIPVRNGNSSFQFINAEKILFMTLQIRRSTIKKSENFIYNLKIS
ncbi:MAG: hypothetical protein OMM_08797, partial [Candidatus Magnetoglobus multicellularis str. Araruama]